MFSYGGRQGSNKMLSVRPLVSMLPLPKLRQHSRWLPLALIFCLLCHHPPDLEEQMSAVVKNLSVLLGIIPPPNGGINLRKTSMSSSSPSLNRQSLVETFFSGRKDSPKSERS